MDTKFFMDHVRNHKYVKANDEATNQLVGTIESAMEAALAPAIDCVQSVHILSTPRLPYELLLVVGGWTSGSHRTGMPISDNSIVAYDPRTDKWIYIMADYDVFGEQGVRIVSFNVFNFKDL